MRTLQTFLIASLLSLSMTCFASYATTTTATMSMKPHFDSMLSQQLVEKMLNHHEGKDKWLEMTTRSFTHSLYIFNFPKELNPWWISEEQFQTKDRRGYQYYPIESSLLVFKKGEAWAQNWRLPNPPGMMPYFNYQFIFAPWLTLEDGAEITYTGKGHLPNIEREYETVRLQFNKALSQNPDNYLRLFIDPQSGELKGLEYNSTYAPFLDQLKIQGDQFGPGFHIYESFTEIDGLKVPTRYSTYFNGKLAGVHAITNIGFDEPFDEAKAHRQGEYLKVTDHPTKRKLTD